MSILHDLLDHCIHDPEELKNHLPVNEETIQSLRVIAEKYPVCVPPYYLGLIKDSWENDPIRKLCLPDEVELSADGEEDTSGENDNTVVTGMQHKYAETALILTTNQCAMYCRHCFRKRMVGSSAEEIASNIGAMRDYALRHPEINNVLLSGGDALINDNEVLRRYLDAFSDIGSLDFIRIGSRVPVVLPQRITEDPELLDMLRSYNQKKQIIIVTHFNHPREITEESRLAVRKLLECGCPVRNQTVLLKGINDDSAVLSGLMNRLTSIGVMPYYVFQCRPARGVMNQFQVPLQRGYQLVEEAKSTLSGPAKAFRYVMSHVTGKIEILGSLSSENPGNGGRENSYRAASPQAAGAGVEAAGTAPGTKMLFRYHQAKYPEDQSRFFTMPVEEEQCWLPAMPR